MRDTVKAFKALSDETRLRILNVLLERECCVCEVMQALEISQSRASRNLGILHDAGFLSLRRDGLWSLYSIDRQAAESFPANLVQVIEKSLAGDEVMARDRERLSGARRVGPGCPAPGRRPGAGAGP